MPSKRIVCYVPPEHHHRLKAHLALQGKSISKWIREQVEQLLDSIEDDDDRLERGT